MIKANELRIGNHISFKGKWNGIVESISSWGVEIDKNHGVFTYDVLEGIPLTEEILLKCGFDLIKDNYIIKIDDFLHIGLHCQDYSLLISDSWGHDELTPTRYIASLHQLQNLYFALTGEELPYVQKQETS